MRLKRVKIFGFKTFADRTEFNIEGGVVAVVGPNGCGKSNLVDAILWGLGEANARHLRALTSQDVIFSGSSRRKPVGFAEVTLLFDNSEGVLPVPTSEVTITRRLTRSGDSEYLINRQPCRQKDIYELLADSGLGRSGYAIVGQKEIDQALSASPEDRRAWVDEAAGVVRYRTRKQDAERRLTAARGHLERVDDVLRELEVQREPLQKEAEVARAYRSLLDSLRTVEQGLLVREVSIAVREVEEARLSIERTTKLIQAENARAEELESHVKFIGEAVSELEREMDAVRSLQQSSLTGIERAQAEVRLAQERLRGLDQMEASLKEESGSLFSQLEEAKRDLAAAEQEESTEAETLKRLSEDARGSDTARQKLQATLNEAETQLREARKQHQLHLRQQTEAEHRRERLQLLQREQQGIDAELPKLQSQSEQAENALKQRESELAILREKGKAGGQRVRDAKAAQETHATELRKLLSDRALLEGRRRGIEATLEANEGMPQGPRAVLEAQKRNLLRGDYRPVAAAVVAPKEMALAFEIALGGAANDLIVDSEAEAKAAIAYLKEQRLGRATFQPRSMMSPREDNRLAALTRQPGVLGVASDLCKCADADRPVLQSLLNRVLIVESLDAALKLTRTDGWKRIVTLEGEVLHSSGAVTGGIQAKGHYGMVQRKADLTELETDAQKLSARIADIERANAELAEEEAQAADDAIDLRTQVETAEEAHAEAANLARALRGEFEDANRAKSKLDREAAALADPPDHPVPEIDLAPFELRRDEALQHLNHHATQAEHSSQLVVAAEHRLRQAEQRRRHADRRVAASQEADEKRHQRIASLGPEREAIKAEMAAHERAREDAEARTKQSAQRLHDLEHERSSKLEESLALAEQATGARKAAQTLGESIHTIELNRVRSDSRRANALQRLMEEYSLTEEDALAQAPTELPADAPQIVSKLRRELKAMGDVNLGAIEAYERLSERWDDLTTQREDVLGGIAQVQESIAQLDHLTRDRFLETFAKLESTFAEFFQKLFPGGQGRVRLTSPESLLETGVELEVTLPGKKRQPLALLSGGERSLCGVAFLFGLLQVKPSPLVVLDEVDAPLDGRNVERFADLLRDFTDRVQFIVITHNHATILRADVFLGVSMQEPGVSILVPVRLPEPASSARAVVELEAVGAVANDVG